MSDTPTSSGLSPRSPQLLAFQARRIEDGESFLSWGTEHGTLVDSTPETPCPDCRSLTVPKMVAVTDAGEFTWLLRCPMDGQWFEQRTL